MSELSTALLVFAVMIASGVLGAWTRRRLPAQHLNEESKDFIKIGIAGLTTLAALVLGLLVASSKSSFDAKDVEIKQGAAKILQLDNVLRQYGPQGDALRALLLKDIESHGNDSWITVADDPRNRPIHQVELMVAGLGPADDLHRNLQARAMELAYELGQLHWLLIQQSTSSISIFMLSTLVFWLAVISAGTMLLAPDNATVKIMGTLCAIAVATAIFIILEMDHPFEGFIRISDVPVQNVLKVLRQ